MNNDTDSLKALIELDQLEAHLDLSIDSLEAIANADSWRDLSNLDNHQATGELLILLARAYARHRRCYRA